MTSSWVGIGLFLLEDEEVVLAVGFGEVVAACLFEAGAFDFGADDFFVEAVVGSVAVAVDDAEESAGAHGGVEIGEENLGVGDLVVDLQHQCGVDGIGEEFGVVGCAEVGLDVEEVFLDGALADGVDGLGVDVFCNDVAGGADALCGADGEPAASGADVGYGFAAADVEQVHDAVDLEVFGAAGVLEDVEVAGVGRTGGVCGKRGLRLGCGKCEGEGGGEEEESEAHRR
jgi:hypothetical protein